MSLINRVASSGLEELNLVNYKPSEKIIEIDLKDHLYMGLVAKEKEFRASIAALDDIWLKDKAIAIVCSTDAILPSWVFMVMADKFYTNTAYFDYADTSSVLTDLWKRNLQHIDWSTYKDKKVVLKAMSEIPESVYMVATHRLKPYVKTLLYGEIGMPKVIFKN